MSEENFSRDEIIGRNGEKFFKQHSWELLQHGFMGSKHPKHVEGMDFVGFFIKGMGEPRPIQREDWYPEDIYPEGVTMELPLEAIPATVEVKTTTSKELLIRDNNKFDPSTTIQFELWGKTDNGIRTKGWLYGMAYPEAFNKERLAKGLPPAVPPTVLMYVFAVDRMGENVFATIAFEDYAALEARLREICPEIWPNPGEDWRIDAVDWKKQKTMIPAAGKANVWHVPFSLLSDLATVTMIGDDPDIEITNKSSKQLQARRLQYLKRIANGRHVCNETENIDTD